ncbi:MAG: hypothetical protein ACLFQO_08560 [Cyclobacteriaceae bacterium]
MSSGTDNTVNYNINLSFQEIKLPPFEDILVVGRQSEQGKVGLSKSLELLVPESFTLIEVEDNNVSAIFINSRILKKIKKEEVLEILRNRVYPFVSEKEIVKVDFKITISFQNIEVQIER